MNCLNKKRILVITKDIDLSYKHLIQSVVHNIISKEKDNIFQLYIKNQTVKIYVCISICLLIDANFNNLTKLKF